MAEPARRIPSSAERKMRGASPVRIVGDLPKQQEAANDNARARQFIRDRQSRALQASPRPANDNAEVSETDATDEEKDIYGAAQRASDERIRQIHTGDSLDEGQDQAEESSHESSDTQNEQEPQEALSAPERDYQRMLAFRRQKAQQEINDQEDQEDEVSSVAAENNSIQKQAVKKAAQRRLIKAGFGATGVGLIVTLLIWDYEVFIERKAPTWKIFLVVFLHGLTFILFLLQILAPIILIVVVLYGAREILPESVRGIVDSLFSSI